MASQKQAVTYFNNLLKRLTFNIGILDTCEITEEMGGKLIPLSPQTLALLTIPLNPFITNLIVYYPISRYDCEFGLMPVQYNVSKGDSTLRYIGSD